MEHVDLVEVCWQVRRPWCARILLVAVVVVEQVQLVVRTLAQVNGSCTTLAHAVTRHTRVAGYRSDGECGAVVVLGVSLQILIRVNGDTAT